MRITNMPGCAPSRDDDFMPWTAYKVPDEFYVVSYESMVEAIVFSFKEEFLLEKKSGGKIVSFTNFRRNKMKAAKEARS